MGAWSTEFETGLIDDFAFTIRQSIFAPDVKYNGGNTVLLQWHGTTDNEDLPETHVYFPLGKGWSSKDGGVSIVHDSGKSDKYFVQSSLIAKLITRCVTDFGMGDLLESRGGPFESSPWVNLVFRMKYQPQDYGQGIDAKPKLFPVQFLGEAGNVVAAIPTPTGSNPAAAILARQQTAAPVSLRDQVIDAIRPHKLNGDFTAAQTAALQVPGVADDTSLVNLLLDESGLYAAA